MGVPGFFMWLLKQNKSILQNKLNANPDVLYIDANCLFHPQCFKVLELVTDTDEKLEKLMIKRILAYIDYLIDYVKPSQYTYIAVDGVAPVAKIGQQRKRRYRSVDDTVVKNEIKKKYKKSHNDTWSNIVITPGTEFMERLHLAIMKHYNGKDVIYSSYHTEGEGEHKILEHIRTTNFQASVIYGLDADLIFLAMASKQKNIYLLREADQFGTKIDKTSDTIEEELTYVSIDMAKDSYNSQIRSMVQCNTDHIDTFVDDFVFICYLLGNDFLPHFPSIDIKKEGLETLLDVYVECFRYIRKNLIDKKINMDFLIMMFKYLGDDESYYFTNIVPKYDARSANRTCRGTTDYEIEVWELENMKNFHIRDPIQLGYGFKDEWKFRYYEYYFRSSEHQYELIDNLCENYLEGLVWVMQYYFSGCASWKWQYKYNHAPFISDIYEYLMRTKLDVNKIKFNKDKAIKIPDQLLSVIPPKHIELLPKSYKSLMNSIESPIIDMFPISVKLDMLHKDQYWKCIPMIPYLDIDRIENATKSYNKFTKKELTKFNNCGQFNLRL
jgi:5'-3' exonuclease